MNNLEFYSSIINSLIWPLICLVVLFLFRKSISGLIPRVTRLKYKDFETDFQSLSVSDQSLLFLDGVARKHKWTFYKARREKERELGLAFSTIVSDLLDVEKEELLKKLREWLKSGDPKQIWFASEIIGWFKITELGKELSDILPVYTDIDLDDHLLNCLWADARIRGVKHLTDLLVSTKSGQNQAWLLFVFEQMFIEKHLTKELALTSINEFLNCENITDENKEKAKVLEKKIIKLSNS